MFAYCLNNPVMYTDSTGYDIETDAWEDGDPLNDTPYKPASSGAGDLANSQVARPSSPVKVSNKALRGVNAHAFKQEIVGRNVAHWDIYKDTANDCLLWLGNKAQTIWIETGYFLEDLFAIFFE